MENFPVQSRIRFPLNLILVFLVALLVGGCFSVKPSSSKSGKKYFETFYVGEDGSQYFIKPLLFGDGASDEDIFLDITFRYKDEIRDSAIVNFSIKGPDMHKTVDSLKISNNLMDISSNKIDLLFNEKSNKGFVSRFTTKVPLDEMKRMFDNDKWKLTIYYPTQLNAYEPHRKAQKAINTLRENVFILM